MRWHERGRDGYPFTPHLPAFKRPGPSIIRVEDLACWQHSGEWPLLSPSSIVKLPLMANGGMWTTAPKGMNAKELALLLAK